MADITFPDGRRMHVVRIFGRNRAGERLDYIWLDIARTDTLMVSTQETRQPQIGQEPPPASIRPQKTRLKLKWRDENGGQEDFSDEKRRTAVEVKVCSPDEENLEDPEEFIPVSVIKKVHLRATDKGINRHFLNALLDDKNRTLVSFRRIIHHDTTIDDKAQAAFDGGDSVYYADTSEYSFVGEPDEDQYVEHEVVQRIKDTTTPHWEKSIGNDQRTAFRFKSQWLLDATEPAKDASSGEYNPPWRLDPFENIINCQFAPRVYVLIIGAGPEFATANKRGVEVVDTHTAVPHPTASVPLSCTLIECSANAGEEFASVRTATTGGSGGEGGGNGASLIYVVVYPKTEEVLANWHEWAEHIRGVNVPDGEEEDPEIGPFLWIVITWSYAPVSFDFKIKYKPHLTSPAPGVRDVMVQAYPTSGGHSGPGGLLENVDILGFIVNSYRLDKDGTGQVYKSPPEWSGTTVKFHAGFPDSLARGLEFGQDPPLIAVDLLADV
jgi:hypothetical protein